MKLGDAFLPRYPEENRHLFVVVHREPDLCISVNFTTKTDACDTSCEATKGEHPFLSRDSIVRYDGELRWTGERFIELDSQYLIAKLYEPVSAKLLDRIQRGALKSKFASGKLKKAIQKSLASKTP